MTTLVLTGDVMLGRGVNDVLGSKVSPEELWGDTLPLLEDADLRLVNLECAVTAHRRRWARTRKAFHFRADPEKALGVLQAGRIDACSLANNHTLDFEERGLLDTLEHLEAADIRYAGAGRDEEEAARPALLPGGVALVAFTDNEPPFAAGPERPGTNYLPVSLEPEVLSRVEAAIETGREAGAHTIVFSNHWGPNMVQRPSSLFRRFARAVIDRGADVYYGHSAHVFQGVEIYRGKPILYDTGDFIDDYAIDERMRNDRSFLFRVTVEDGDFLRLELYPVTLPYARATLAAGDEREAIFEKMEDLSAQMGTAFAREEERLVLERG